jgi:hypothetical protein
MNISELNHHQIIFQARIEDSEDPAMLGRVRAVLTSNEDQFAITKGVDWNPEKDKWTTKDPFIFLPILPFFLSQTPKKHELINVIFQNKQSPLDNKFYIQGPFSSPLRTNFEESNGAQALLAYGDRIKKSPTIRNQNGSYNVGTEGIYVKPGDVGIMGRGTSDLIFKENEVILRAGKIKSINVKPPLKFPEINKNRGFLQLSYFNQNKVLKDTKTKTNIVETPLKIKKIIIWNILNLENINPNEDGTIGLFNGSVGLYNLTPSEKTTTKTFDQDTINDLEVGKDFSGPIEEINFTEKTLNETTLIINDFMDSLFTRSIKFNDYPVRDVNNFKDGFPFAITPSKITYMSGAFNYSPTTAEQIFKKRNYNAIFNEIKIDNNFNGFFIVSSNNNNAPEYGTPSSLEKNDVKIYDWEATPKSYGVLGSQKIYLLSQDSKSSRGFIDLQNTIYGITQENFLNGEDSIDLKTFSTVRGEELMSLLSKIVSYLIGHLHNPVEKPDTVSTGNGVTVEELQKAINAANELILNQNIRIN